MRILFLITYFCLYSIDAFSFDHSEDQVKYERFRTEFKSNNLKSNGQWALAPLGALTVTTGIVVGVAGGFTGIWLGSSAPDFNAKAQSWGIFIGGVGVGVGLTYLGTKMFKKGTENINLERKSSKQKQLDSIKRFEGY